MKIIINGARVRDFRTFVAEVERELSPSGTGSEYFGFDLHSFGDCLQGGYLGTPPYEIIVEHAAAMIEAMDHRGLVLYCEEMLNVIDKGGRGLVQEDSRRWYEITRDAAVAKSGPTLLQFLIDVIDAAPAKLTLLD